MSEEKGKRKDIAMTQDEKDMNKLIYSIIEDYKFRNMRMQFPITEVDIIATYNDQETEAQKLGRVLFKAGIEYGRKGYIKADKAINVVADLLNSMELNVTTNLEELNRIDFIAEAKEELEIEDE
jgi:predicted hydrocarbon binding protein